MEAKDLTDEQLRKLAEIVLNKDKFREIIKYAIREAGNKNKVKLLGLTELK